MRSLVLGTGANRHAGVIIAQLSAGSNGLDVSQAGSRGDGTGGSLAGLSSSRHQGQHIADAAGSVDLGQRPLARGAIVVHTMLVRNFASQVEMPALTAFSLVLDHQWQRPPLLMAGLVIG